MGSNLTEGGFKFWQRFYLEMLTGESEEGWREVVTRLDSWFFQTPRHNIFSREGKKVGEIAMKLTTTMMTLMRMENGNNDDDGNGDADGAIVGSWEAPAGLRATFQPDFQPRLKYPMMRMALMWKFLVSNRRFERSRLLQLYLEIPLHEQLWPLWQTSENASTLWTSSLGLFSSNEVQIRYNRSHQNHCF